VAKKSIDSLSASDVQGKKVFVRADFNVPVDADVEGRKGDPREPLWPSEGCG
jgi:hypothetical protein